MKHNRQFKTLRLSLTERCNFSCVYCFDSNGKSYERNLNSSLSPTKMAELVAAIHQELQLKSVHLTGGEPALYPSLLELIALLKQIGIAKISMTTNGTKLSSISSDLKHRGLNSINISLDAIDPSVYYKITGKPSIAQIIEGVDKAIESGLEVKINSTIMNGINDNEIIPLLEFAKSRGIVIRFLELMKLGHLEHQFDDLFFPEQDILKIIGHNYKLTALDRSSSSTARYWMTDVNQQFGIIANHSNPFCHDCDRLRMDSQGVIYGCLTADRGVSALEGLKSSHFLREVLSHALTQKQEYFSSRALSMKAIGG